MNLTVALGTVVNRWLGRIGLRVFAIGRSDDVYNQDGLTTIHNHEFMRDAAFVKAYSRGVKAGGYDYHMHWRIHVALWVASCARRLDGDFVECGVNRGFVSSAVMEWLDWDASGKMFFLLDTFGGGDARSIATSSESGAQRGMCDPRKCEYTSDVAAVRANFATWKNVSIIVGFVPDILPCVKTKRVAYLHLDMNCAAPEFAAAEFFWPRLLPGGFILLDDYAYYGFRPQKLAMDEFAATHGVNILALPTGQGIIIKPTP